MFSWSNAYLTYNHYYQVDLKVYFFIYFPIKGFKNIYSNSNVACTLAVTSNSLGLISVTALSKAIPASAL